MEGRVPSSRARRRRTEGGITSSRTAEHVKPLLSGLSYCGAAPKPTKYR